MFVKTFSDEVLNLVKEHVRAKLVEFDIGTGTTTPTSLDSTLENEVMRKTIEELIESGANEFTFEIWVSSVLLDGQTLTEVGVFDNDNNLIFRELITPITKDTSFELKFVVTVRWNFVEV